MIDSNHWIEQRSVQSIRLLRIFEQYAWKQSTTKPLGYYILLVYLLYIFLK